MSLTDEAGTGGNVNPNASLSGGVLTIKNIPGNSLPNTGGMGTEPIVALGLLLVLAAIAILFVKPRMGRESH